MEVNKGWLVTDWPFSFQLVVTEKLGLPTIAKPGIKQQSFVLPELREEMEEKEHTAEH